jgi:hypothetical protein
LTCREFGDLAIDDLQDLCPRHGVRRALGAQCVFQCVQRLQKVEVVAFVAFEVRQVLHHRAAHLLAAEVVHRGVGQDPLEHQRQFGRRAVSVLFGQADHRVLHDVQCSVVAADRIDRALEGPLFDALQEVGQFFFGGQRGDDGCARFGRARLSHCGIAKPGISAAVQHLRCIMTGFAKRVSGS